MQNKLVKMILRRIVQSLIGIFIVTLFVFLLIQLVPGDPIVNFLGPSATEEQIAYYTELFGYDKPVLVQYVKWIQGLFRGEMGRSVALQKEISEVIFQRLGITCVIVFSAFFFAVIFGIVFGVLSAKKRGSAVDSSISFLANIGMSMPKFWFGMILILLFALRLKLLPTSGYVSLKDGFIEWLRHLILPVIVTAMGPLASYTRQTRSSMLEVIRQDYVTTARAKGLGQREITLRQNQLRNALICEPKLILADEPTTALDVTIQAQMLGLIGELQKRLNTAMILVTHDLGVVAQTCEKVAVMYAGEIIEYGTAEHIFNGAHWHPYTEGLFKAIPKLDEESRRLETIDGMMSDPTQKVEGCRFADRCKYAGEACKKMQHMQEAEPGHFIKCHRIIREGAGGESGWKTESWLK